LEINFTKLSNNYSASIYDHFLAVQKWKPSHKIKATGGKKTTTINYERYLKKTKKYGG